LWAKPVRHRLTPARAESDRWAALVFGSGEHNKLTEPQMMVVAERGGVVSPVTSYLAIEPGVRPSRDGIAYGRFGRRARPPRVRMGMSNVSGRKPTFDGTAYLTHELASAWLACGGAGVRAELSLQTTLAEVVTVDEPHASDMHATRGMLACLRESAWNMALPSSFDEEHAN
jgi:hypothetical protein